MILSNTGFGLPINCLKKKFLTHFFQTAQNATPGRPAHKCILRSKISRFPKRKFHSHVVTCYPIFPLCLALPPTNSRTPSIQNVSVYILSMPVIKSKAKAKNLGVYSVKVRLDTEKINLCSYFCLKTAERRRNPAAR
jgi:hypothetical protein